MCCQSAAANKCSEKATTQKWKLHGKKELVSLWFEVLLPDKFQTLASNRHD